MLERIPPMLTNATARISAGLTQSGLSPKDWLSIGFSAAALLISSTSFYFTNLRVDDALTARLLSVTMTSDHTALLRVAFANSGNRPAIVEEARSSFETNAPRGSLGDSIGGGILETIPPATLPLLIAPRDLRLVQLIVEVSDLSKFFILMGLPVTSDFGVGLGSVSFNQFPADLRFLALDSTGAEHEAHSEKAFYVDVTSDGLMTAGMYAARAAQIDLFGSAGKQ